MSSSEAFSQFPEPEQSPAIDFDLTGVPLDVSPVTAQVMGDYLEDPSTVRKPMRDKEEQQDHARRIEAGLYARAVLNGEIERPEGATPATAEELQIIATDGEIAMGEFIKGHLGLVRWVARKYSDGPRRNDHDLTFDDLTQIGFEGLVRGLKKFDYARGNKVASYAKWWIRASITRTIDYEGRAIRLPVNVVEERIKLSKSREAFALEYGHDPSDEELAAYAELKLEKVQSLKAADKQTVSYHKKIGEDDGSELLDVLPYHAPSAEEIAEQGIIREMLEGLFDAIVAEEKIPPEYINFIRLRYGLDGGEPLSNVEAEKATGLSYKVGYYAEKKVFAAIHAYAAKHPGTLER
jgi:RNA polymerase sigma factor (sigma-70 family)